MKTIDISGMGDSYELACQKMLINGLRWLKEHPDFKFDYKEYKGIFGLTMAESEDAKALDKAIAEGVDPSGAMHSGVISHLAYIHKHGYQGWLDEAVKQGRELLEQPTEEEIDKALLIAQAEWELKLAGGYNPLAQIPQDDIISVNPNDPESWDRAAREIKRILESK